MPLRLAKVLLRIGHPPVLSVDLRLELPDPGIALEHANAANAETQRNIKLIQNNIRGSCSTTILISALSFSLLMFSLAGVQAKFEEESRAKAAAQDNLIANERRAHSNANSLEEAIFFFLTFLYLLILHFLIFAHLFNI